MSQLFPRCKNFYTCGVANDNFAGHPEEEAVLDYANDALQSFCRFFRSETGDRQIAMHDKVMTVGHIRRTIVIQPQFRRESLLS